MFSPGSRRQECNGIKLIETWPFKEARLEEGQNPRDETYQGMKAVLLPPTEIGLPVAMVNHGRLGLMGFELGLDDRFRKTMRPQNFRFNSHVVKCSWVKVGLYSRLLERRLAPLRRRHQTWTSIEEVGKYGPAVQLSHTREKILYNSKYGSQNKSLNIQYPISKI